MHKLPVFQPLLALLSLGLEELLLERLELLLPLLLLLGHPVLQRLHPLLLRPLVILLLSIESRDWSDPQ